MLKDIIRHYSVIHISGREYHIRYSLNALLCLEMTYKPLSELLKVPYMDWSIEDVLQLAHAAMCSLPENRKAVTFRDFDYVEPTLAELGVCLHRQTPAKKTPLQGLCTKATSGLCTLT